MILFAFSNFSAFATTFSTFAVATFAVATFAFAIATFAITTFAITTFVVAITFTVAITTTTFVATFTLTLTLIFLHRVIQFLLHNGIHLCGIIFHFAQYASFFLFFLIRHFYDFIRLQVFIHITMNIRTRFLRQLIEIIQHIFFQQYHFIFLNTIRYIIIYITMSLFYQLALHRYIHQEIKCERWNIFLFVVFLVIQVITRYQ